MSNVDELTNLIKAGQKIQAIKMLRENDGIDLKEAKEKVEELQHMLVESGEMKATTKSGCGLWFIMAMGLGGGAALHWLL